MGRSPCCDEDGLKKGPWTPEEDKKLVDYIHKNGHGSWRALPKLAGLNRCGKSCRLRWTNYLRPDIKRGKFSQDEEQTILNLHSILGNKWSAIASHLPGRTDNEIKNFWNTHLKKKLIQMGFDPMTHQPRTDLFATLPQLMALVQLKDLLLDHTSSNSNPLDHQTMRLQAEALQLAKLQYVQYLLQSSSSTSSPPTPHHQHQNGAVSSDMELINLLNSLPNQQLNSNSEYGFGNMISSSSPSPPMAANNNTHQPLHHILLPPLCDPREEEAVTFMSPNSSSSCLPAQTTPTTTTATTVALHNNNNSTNHNVDIPSSAEMMSSWPAAVVLPSSSNSNPAAGGGGDGGSSSSSSYAGGVTSSYSNWPELFLDDPILSEISL
ncbi:unnamed protein product [Linum tenue]|uniref:Uncharacterized protein n=1 Tax=Linum tenue TaxID=586396 RepID=A0AAV0PBC1_9ROSI|nr:unnamed protein product [Linum tenue]